MNGPWQPTTGCFRAAARPRRGTILVVTLWITLVLVGVVLVMGQAVRVDATSAANDVAAIQAAAIERGAEQYVLGLIDQNGEDVLTLSDDNFQAVKVGDGYFWIIRPNYGDSQFSSYGLVDEASKLNLNTAPQAALSLLPGIPQDVPASILDWRDADSNTTDGGAENDYYSNLSPTPYECKNAPLETVEELLLLKDITPDVLYGQTASGLPRAAPLWSEDANPTIPLGADPATVYGLFDYVTIYSAEPNTDANGAARVSVNDAQSLRTLLQTAFGASRAGAILTRTGGGRAPAPFRDIFDFYFRAGLTLSEFQTVADRLTSTTQTTPKGRINVGTAPREVLLCLPGLLDDDVSTLIDRRAAADVTNLAWVADALGPKSIGLGNLITSFPTQYSADIVAVSGNGRAFKRCRIVVDTLTRPIHIVYRKDLTEAGWPMDRGILSSLRAGGGLSGPALSPSRSLQQ